MSTLPPLVQQALLRKKYEEFIVPEPDGDGTTRLHRLARSGALHQAPPEVLTVENLTIMDDAGKTPFSIAVSRPDLFDKFPKTLLTPELISARNPKTGATAFMEAIQNGMPPDELPLHLIEDPKEFLREDNEGRCLRDLLIATDLKALPAAMRTKEVIGHTNSAGENALHVMALRGSHESLEEMRKFPVELFSPEVLSKEVRLGRHAATAIFICVANGTIKHFPPGVVTRRHLLDPAQPGKLDAMPETRIPRSLAPSSRNAPEAPGLLDAQAPGRIPAVLVAARKGHLGDIPERLLDAEMLGTFYGGESPLSVAAGQKGGLDGIPEDILFSPEIVKLTVNDLTMDNPEKHSCVMQAWRTGRFTPSFADQINPEEFWKFAMPSSSRPALNAPDTRHLRQSHEPST